MSAPDFEVHDTGTQRALDEKDVEIAMLKREKTVMMTQLNWDQDALDQYLDAYERSFL